MNINIPDDVALKVKRALQVDALLKHDLATDALCSATASSIAYRNALSAFNEADKLSYAFSLAYVKEKSAKERKVLTTVRP